jgi:biopolymer transport protein TolQ
MLCFGSFLSPAFEAFSKSDFIGQLIVIVQIGMSVVSWATMLAKRMALQDIQRRTRLFVDNFIREEDSLALYYKRYAFSDTPAEIVYFNTCERLVSLIPPEQREALARHEAALAFPRKRMELVETTCAHTVNETTEKLNKGMVMLANITNVAPLAGLFGTVWGVMLAFFAMAESGSADIAELAPGISSALLTTVMGLLVAIPSTIAYNCLQASIDKAIIDVEGFSEELMGKLALQYQEG